MPGELFKADLCFPRTSFSFGDFYSTHKLFRAESERLAAERLLEEAKSLIEVQKSLEIISTDIWQL